MTDDEQRPRLVVNSDWLHLLVMHAEVSFARLCGFDENLNMMNLKCSMSVFLSSVHVSLWLNGTFVSKHLPVSEESLDILGLSFNLLCSI